MTRAASGCLEPRAWSELLAYRGDATLPEPAEAAAAMAHATHCSRCAGLLVEVDPSLLFSRLRVPVVEAEASDPDIAAMRDAVAHLRRVSSSVGSAAVLGEPRRGLGATPRRFVAAAGLVAALVGALAFGFGREVPSGSAIVAQPAPLATSLEAVPTSFGPLREGVEDDWRLSPVVESLDRSDARVYEIDGARDLSVTMIVDASFDV